jgi:hypothetical protein
MFDDLFLADVFYVALGVDASKLNGTLRIVDTVRAIKIYVALRPVRDWRGPYHTTYRMFEPVPFFRKIERQCLIGPFR